MEYICDRLKSMFGIRKNKVVVAAKKAKKNKHTPDQSEYEHNGTPQWQPSPVFSSCDSEESTNEVPEDVLINGLKHQYIQNLKPFEVTYRYNDFVSPLLADSDFDAKPMVLLLGQCSSGKTTLIKHLLGMSYPGAEIGLRPATNKFVAVMNGPAEIRTQGDTIVFDPDMPFSGLRTFGAQFLSEFECVQMKHPLLEKITFVDTPGVRDIPRSNQSYDFTGVTPWFAAKCDLILLVFDAREYVINDEFKRVIRSLRGHQYKIRVVLNKADQVDSHQLMRVYGALMCSLGKLMDIFESSELRVYISSFNDKPINDAASGIDKALFEKEQCALLSDLKEVSDRAFGRRVGKFIRRARDAKVHAYIISHLKKKMPRMVGKAKTQRRLIAYLEDQFAIVQKKHNLPPNDLPNVKHFREVLGGYRIDKFEELKPNLLQAVDDMLKYYIPELWRNYLNSF